MVDTNATVLSMEQVFEESGGPQKARAKTMEEIPGYVEYRYRVTLQHEDGTTTEEIISLYLEEK